MTDNADTALRHVLAVRELDELTRLRAENERLQNVHTFLLEDAGYKLWEPKWVYNHVEKTLFMIACENGELDAAKFLASLPGASVHWIALGGNNAYAYTKDALDQLEDDNNSHKPIDSSTSQRAHISRTAWAEHTPHSPRLAFSAWLSRRIRNGFRD